MTTKEMNEIADLIIKVSSITSKSDKPNKIIQEERSEKILLTSIDEHKHTYDHTSNIYDQLRLKALALIAGEVAVLTFLFNDWKFWDLVKGGDRLFMFFTGVIMLVAAFAIFLWIISTVKWLFPHDSRLADELVNDKNYPSHRSFLNYLHDDYIAAIDHNRKIVGDKCKKFDWSIFLLAGGVIIVMVIKFGGPQG